MTIKTHSKFTRTASEVIEQILLICTGLYPDETEKKVWKMVILENKNYTAKRFDDKDKEFPVTAAKLRIERIPQGLLDRLLKLFFGSFGLTIVIPPVHSHVKIHTVDVDLVLGDRRVSGRRSPLVKTLYRKDISQILSILQEKVPELNTRSIE